MSSNNVVHKISVSVKAHFGDPKRKFENVAEDDLAEDGLFEFS